MIGKLINYIRGKGKTKSFNNSSFNRPGADWPDSYDGGKRELNSSLMLTEFKSWAGICARENGKKAGSAVGKLYVRDNEHMAHKHNLKKDDFIARKLYTSKKLSLKQRQMNKLIDFGYCEEMTSDHPITQILSNPSLNYTGFEFIQSTVEYLQMSGNCFWRIMFEDVEGHGQVPVGLELLPTTNISLVLKKGKLRGYELKNDKVRQLINPAHVIHIRDSLNLQCPAGLGRGCLETAWGAVGLHDSKRIMDTSWFENQSRPDLLLYEKAGSNIDKKNFERFRTEWANKFRGGKKTGQLAFIPADVGVEPLNQMDRVVGDTDIVIAEISKSFGYPLSKLLGNSATRANSTQNDYDWSKDTITPYLNKIEDVINQQLIPLFELDDDVIFVYDSIVPLDKVFHQNQINTAYAAGRITLNEARVADGFEEVEGGDKFKFELEAPSTVEPTSTEPAVEAIRPSYL